MPSPARHKSAQRSSPARVRITGPAASRCQQGAPLAATLSRQPPQKEHSAPAGPTGTLRKLPQYWSASHGRYRNSHRDDRNPRRKTGATKHSRVSFNRARVSLMPLACSGSTRPMARISAWSGVSRAMWTPSEAEARSLRRPHLFVVAAGSASGQRQTRPSVASSQPAIHRRGGPAPAPGRHAADLPRDHGQAGPACRVERFKPMSCVTSYPGPATQFRDRRAPLRAATASPR